MATQAGGVYIDIRAEDNRLQGDLNKASRKIQSSVQSMQSQVTRAFKIMSVAATAAVTVVAYKTVSLMKDSALLAARFETLGIVMKQVGSNAGYSAKEMDDFDIALRKTGISMIESRNSLTKMAQANLDLTKATQLGRIAQDAAVIGNINSSEAFQRMIYGIQSGQTEVLKSIGINVNFGKSYKDVANATNRTTESFSEAEKAIIRQNVVIEYGTRIAGVYEAAMSTAGKKLSSFTRYVEDFKVKMGAAFGPAMVILIDSATKAMKEMQAQISKPEAQKALENMSIHLASILTSLASDLPGKIDKIEKSLSGIVGIYNSLPDGVVGAAGVGILGRILTGSTPTGAFIAGVALLGKQLENVFKPKLITNAILLSTNVNTVQSAIANLQLSLGDLGSESKFGKKWLFSDEKLKEIADGEELLKKLQERLSTLQFQAEMASTALTATSMPLTSETSSKKAKPATGDTAKSLSEMELYFLEEKISGVLQGWFEDIEALEVKLYKASQAFVNFDTINLTDKELRMQVDSSEVEKVREQLEERFNIQKEFDLKYQEMGLTRFDLERLQIERMAEIYKKAGVDENKIAEMTSKKNIAISKAEREQKIADIGSTVGAMAQGFKQIAEMGGKNTKEAFAMYKAFKITETLISTYSGAMKAYESLASIPYVGPALGIAAAAMVVGFGMQQVGMIRNSQPPSYDQGGISSAKGIYQTGNISEAHIPIPSGGKIPVKMEGGGQGNVVNITMNNPVFQDLATQRQVMSPNC
jgi:hypothetical protein